MICSRLQYPSPLCLSPSRAFWLLLLYVWSWHFLECININPKGRILLHVRVPLLVSGIRLRHAKNTLTSYPEKSFVPSLRIPSFHLNCPNTGFGLLSQAESEAFLSQFTTPLGTCPSTCWTSVVLISSWLRWVDEGFVRCNVLYFTRLETDQTLTPTSEWRSKLPLR